MATCSMGFEHADPEPEVIPVPVDSGTSENDVRIAEVQAGTDVALAEIRADERVVEMAAELERMRGELAGMKTVLETLAPPPPPEPEPVVIPVPDPAPAPGDAEGSVPDVAKPPKSKKDSGWFSGYR